MPTYIFFCPTCNIVFEDLCSFSEREGIVCETCQGKTQQMMTAPSAVVFKEKKGTSREDNFDYVAKFNHEQNQNLRKAAQAAQGASPYRTIDDMPKYEGKIV